MKSYRSLVPLTALVFLLAGYNFMDAAWTAPVGTPPGNNTDAPINVSSTTQTKAGNFMANIVAAATSTWSPRYCDEFGNNCWDPGTGAPGGGGDTITVGGQCFEPAWAVTCNWNWSGDGNDNSTYIRPVSMSPSSVCAAVGRSYNYHSMVLAECTTPVYSWVASGWSCNARTPSSCQTTTGTNVRTVTCQDQYGAVASDSSCTGTKPATTGTSCTRRGGGSDC